MLRIGMLAPRSLRYEPHAITGYAENWNQLSAGVRADMHRLGVQARLSGEDMRGSPFWRLLAHKWAYEHAFERRARKTIRELAPDSIYRGLVQGMTVVWRGWEIALTMPDALTDPCCQESGESRIWAISPTGALQLFRRCSPGTARDIYLHVITSIAASHVGAAPRMATAEQSARRAA
ncbi:hypothetical protein [Paraburkholderia sp. SIMBA_054]|uniref:hypothetical protein n=1 Tax=Paraburkholderia sp. SIMBA_054 TaxID=3085795 RepID=UPI00397DE7DB